jgi:hypothetical protein
MKTLDEIKERKRLYMIEYRKSKPNKGKEYMIEYRKSKPNIIKTWRDNNKTKINKTTRLYRKNNKDKIAKIKNKHVKNRKLRDPVFKLSCNMRTAIYTALMNKKIPKKSKTVHILGCSFEAFKVYLESKWEPWMNWENYGKYNGELNFGWDVDHIIPLNIGQSELDIFNLNHYTNFQPLCSYVNRVIKGRN